MNIQKSELENLFQEMCKKIPVDDIYGNYQKPTSLIQLENIIRANEIDTETIGFLLHESKPDMPAPTDIIPFAKTGGDGCYFAFLTDYGYYESLEKAPIVFISPADFDVESPNQANKLFARNFMDFLRVMITMQQAEIVRFKDLAQMDFDGEIQALQADMLLASSAKRVKAKEKTIETIKKEYGLHEINDLHGYFLMLEFDRKKEDYIDLNDGLGLKTHVKDRFNSTDFSDKLQLSKSLKHASKVERICFYREAPYLYKHYIAEYQEIVLLIAEYLYLDGFTREAKILKFEVEKNVALKKYLEARRMLLAKEKNHSI